jgi:hypothetical protein
MKVQGWEKPKEVQNKNSCETITESIVEKTGVEESL